jgi:ubiquinone/menaquinone biosynthesis C-methylase UbiE
MKLGQKTFLEVGIGSSVVSNYLRSSGCQIVTVDIDHELRPDVNASILQLPFKDNSFDLVMCFQVLEHIPFDAVVSALDQLYRVTKRYVVISLPERSKYFRLDLNIYPIITKRLCFTIPSLLSQVHEFDGEHYWEIGKKDFSLKRIKRLFETNSFNILRDYRVPEKPFHHIFVLEKKAL